MKNKKGNCKQIIFDKILYFTGDPMVYFNEYLNKCDFSKEHIEIVSSKDIIFYSDSTPTYTDSELKKMNISNFKLDDSNILIRKEKLKKLKLC